MIKILSVCALLVLVFAPERASAQSSIGAYSGCKKLSGSARKACESCVGGGNFYQPKSKSCGMAPGMKKSQPLKGEKPPPRPKSMPKVAYATIPAGTFEIGAREGEPGADDDELFDATVTITRPFQMQTTEVSHGQWHFVMDLVSPSYNKECGQDCPVGYVSWIDTLRYLNALSKREGLEQCYEISEGKFTWPKGLACAGYRLPTEAEWEYAARGGTEGATYGELDDIAWHYDNSDGKLHPPGKKEPNKYGLYDMLGNAWEWTWDAKDFKPFSGKMKDPIIGGQETESTGDRVVRGGGFGDSHLYVRAGHRYQYPISSSDLRYGFRPVRTVTKK